MYIDIRYTQYSVNAPYIIKSTYTNNHPRAALSRYVQQIVLFISQITLTVALLTLKKSIRTLLSTLFIGSSNRQVGGFSK